MLDRSAVGQVTFIVIHYNKMAEIARIVYRLPAASAVNSKSRLQLAQVARIHEHTQVGNGQQNSTSATDHSWSARLDNREA